jgi:hypothetical protein
MEKFWIITIAILIFLSLNFLCYLALKAYVYEAFGKKWLKIWGNNVYFWQSSIFVSTAGTVLIMYLLKWAKLMSF